MAFSFLSAGGSRGRRGGGAPIPSVISRRIGRCVLLVSVFIFPLLPFEAPGQPLSLEESASTRSASLAVEADCVKCHGSEVGDLAEGGGAHGRLGCTDCHAGGHPPRNMEIIPPCTVCHQGTAHAEGGACLPCHRNPHRPLDLSLSRAHVAACLSCHPQPGEDLWDFPSAHSIYACTGCHRTHGELQPCLECHRGHVEGGTSGCRECHSPHRPLAVAFDEEAETAVCLTCHAEVGTTLSANPSKHRNLSCAACHAGRHGFLPTCRTCHPSPHPNAMLVRFSGCHACHGDPHSLVF